jgi:hypothetical protein
VLSSWRASVTAAVSRSNTAWGLDSAASPGARAEWPALTIPGSRVLVHGADSWHDIVYRMTPGERQRVLRQLGRRALLVCTPGGRARLRTWLNRRWAGLPEPPGPTRFYGDTALLPAAEAALARLPEPVRALVISECYIMAVGGRLRGWTSAPLKTEGLCPIQISGTEFHSIVSTVAHEAGHRWHAPALLAGGTTPTEHERAEFLAFARAEGWPLAAHEARKAEDERLAELCAAAWTVA